MNYSLVPVSKMNMLRVVLMGVMCLMYQLAQCQKVALVLSGGGAKGLAHVGVLKVLEENNIPVDYIVGTSMGGVIGGFYAAGYSAEQIEEIALSGNLQRWIRGEPDDEYKVYHTGDHTDPSWVSLKLRLDSGFSVSFNPTIAKDHVLNFVLGEKMAHATKISEQNFDSLFVPFRTTGSEIFTQEEKVLKSGDLYKSIRASMAVPFFYRPIKINDQYLFDGGVYNNFPAELARKEFDPDIIIGVNVATKRLTEYPYENDKNLINESILFAILDKTNPQEIDSSDVFIDVQLGRYNAADFKFADKIVQSGYNSGAEKIDEIKEKIGRRISADELAQRRKDFMSKNKSNILFDSIIINGFNKRQLHYLQGQFERSRPLGFNQISPGYYKIISDDYFSSIIPSYTLSPDKNIFELSGNPNPKLIGKIGGTLTTRSISQLYIGFDYKSLRKQLSHYSLKFFTGRFYQSGLFRAKIKFASKSNISFTPEFVFNQWDYINTSDFLIRGSDPTILKRYDYRYGYRIELPVNKKNKVTFENSLIKYVSEYSNNREFLTTDVLDESDLFGYKFGLSFGGNSLNFDQYAYSGSNFNIGVSYNIVRENYFAGNTSSIASFNHRNHNWVNANVSFSKYSPIGKKFVFGYSAVANFSNQASLATKRGTVILLPGYFPFQDSKTLLLENYKSRKYLAVGLKSIIHLASSFQFRIEGHAFNSFEEVIGNASERASFSNENINLKLAGTAGFVFQSLIGPISLSVNYYDDVENQWGVLLHFGHILFHKDSLE